MSIAAAAAAAVVVCISATTLVDLQAKACYVNKVVPQVEGRSFLSKKVRIPIQDHPYPEYAHDVLVVA